MLQEKRWSGGGVGCIVVQMDTMGETSSAVGDGAVAVVDDEWWHVFFVSG